MPFRVSVIVPVYNEAGNINAAIDHLQDLASKVPLEMIVVDGHPRENTLAAITGENIIPITSPPGRGRQMNAGADRATGDIFLFLHADTRLPPQAGRHLQAVWSDPALAGGAFDLGIDSPRPIFRVIERAAAWRSRWTRIPYGDQAIFLKAAIFHRLKGFKAIPIMEDIDLMQRLKQRGGRIAVSPYRVQTSARRWEKEGVFYATFRNIGLSTAFYLGVSPERLARFY